MKSKRVWTFGTLLFLTILVGSAGLLFVGVRNLAASRKSEEHKAEIQVQNFAQAIDLTLSAEIRRIDHALLTVTSEIERSLSSGHLDLARLKTFIDTQEKLLPEAMAIRVSNADGTVILNNPTEDPNASLRGRPYWSILQDQPKAGLVITKPIVGHLTKKWVLTSARRYNRPDGRFGGVVIIPVFIEHFQKALYGFEVGAGGRLTLRDMENGFVTRYPEVVKGKTLAIGDKEVASELRAIVASGVQQRTYSAVTPYDQTKRMFTFRRIQGAPLYVVASLAEEDYLAQWRADRRATFTRLGIAILGFWLLALFLWVFWLAHRRADTALKKAYLLIADTTRIGRVGGWEFDIKTLKQTWTEEVYRIHEVGPDFVPTVENGVEFYTEASRPLVEQAVKRTIEHGEAFDLELEIITAKGTQRSVHTIGKADLENQRIFGFFHDITERKQIENALQRAHESLVLATTAGGVGIWNLDVVNNKLTWDDQMFCLYGKTPEDFGGTYETWKAGVHPDDLERSDAEVQMALRGEKEFDTEFRILWPDGSVRHIKARGHVYRDAAGRPTVMAGTNYDITERIQAEAHRVALEAKNHQLQKAESLGLMAGSIAHHFNNKLQSVMSNLDVMEALPKGTDLTKFLTNAKLATQKAADVSRMMLVYLGHTTLQRETHALSALCRDSLLLIQNTLPNTVALETDFPEPGPVVTANADQIQQVLTNLVTNAWEAMGDAGGCLRLSLTTCPAAAIPITHRFPIGWQAKRPDYALLEVMDSGYGIAEADLEKLFDPFFSTQFLGRGLGLAVVLGIVKAHGGAITVASRKGQGSVFRVYFPVSTETLPTAQEHPLQAPEPEASAAGGTVLLIDDDALLLRTTQELVRILGFTPLTAKDGVEGMEVFRQHQAAIRCVITDLTMPRMDGWETLSALRQIDPTLPVILASGFDKAQVLSGKHPDSPQSFLSKPFNLQQLRDAMGFALGTNSRAGFEGGRNAQTL